VGAELDKGAAGDAGQRILTIAIVTGVLAVAGGWAFSGQDKYTLKVQNGLAFSEFRGYETWQVVSISQTDPLLLRSSVIL
jgi:hypothetical protein